LKVNFTGFKVYIRKLESPRNVVNLVSESGYYWRRVNEQVQWLTDTDCTGKMSRLKAEAFF